MKQFITLCGLGVIAAGAAGCSQPRAASSAPDAPSVSVVKVVRTDLTNYLQDYLAYGLLPGLGYLALLAAAVSIYLEEDFGLDTLAGALLLLAIVNIRNAWDLTLTMVRRHRRWKIDS